MSADDDTTPAEDPGLVTKLHPDDKLLLSTDGITEAENAQLEEFGEDRVIMLVLEIC